VGALQRSANVQEPIVQVDVGPLQAERLASAKAKGQRHRVERLEPIAANSRQQLARLIRVERRDLLAGDVRPVDYANGIARDLD
jgi:hypothetical protein